MKTFNKKMSSTKRKGTQSHITAVEHFNTSHLNTTFTNHKQGTKKKIISIQLGTANMFDVA